MSELNTGAMVYSARAENERRVQEVDKGVAALARAHEALYEAIHAVESAGFGANEWRAVRDDLLTDEATFKKIADYLRSKEEHVEA